MRRGHGRHTGTTTDHPSGADPGAVVSCGEATYRSCREATRARLRQGGPVTGCPLVSPLPVDQVDRVLDLVDDVGAATQEWTVAGWREVARASVRGTSDGLAARVRVQHCVAVTGRQELLRHAEEVVLDGVPVEAGPAACSALTDALAAATVSDVLPIRYYLALTAPLVAAER